MEAPVQSPHLCREGDRSSRRDALVAHLALVNRLTSQVCRRRRLNADESEEFAAHVRLKLVENDYALLARCRNPSSLRTYLTTVIERLFLDYRVSQWGRWRPSANARRGGAVGVILDRLLTRDGFTFNEACHVLQTNYRIACSRDHLYALSVHLPRRARNRLVSSMLEGLAAPDEDPETSFVRHETGRLAEQRKAALEEAIARLSPGDRRLLELRYRRGLPVVAIAQELGLTPKPLYARLEKIVRTLRRSVWAASPNPHGYTCHFADVSITW